jgi:hypothetical protein
MVEQRPFKALVVGSSPTQPKGLYSDLLSWAATQVPEITAAIQSFLNAGFRSAAQVEFVVMIGSLHPVTKAAGLQGSRNFVPKHAFARYC